MKTLFFIPARAGSKGIIRKNTRIFGNKPLVIHSLLLARKFVDDADICLSTDDDQVIEVAKNEGYTAPFIRPIELAGDNTGMREVMLHAIEFYLSKGIKYDNLVLLQPTSPFRQIEHVTEAIHAYDDTLDMVVSVSESKANPYFVLYEEDSEGFLIKSKSGDFTSRQETPKVWQLNGAVYVINIQSLKTKPVSQFTRIKKIIMDQIHSIDLDTEIDWKLATLINDEYKLL